MTRTETLPMTEQENVGTSETASEPCAPNVRPTGVRVDVSREDERKREGNTLHDGAIYDPSGCPRGQHDCAPLSRISSSGFESFMCCGETNNAPVPTDRLRLCIKSTHKHGVDVLVNLDERDAVHTCSALMGGLAALGAVSITARDK